MPVRTRLTRCEDDLLRLLPASAGALAWLTQGDGIVGWGEVCRFEPSGPQRFALADRWWSDQCARMRVDDPVDVPGTGPVAFISLAFADEPGRSVCVVPRYIVGRRDGVSWVTEVGEPSPGSLTEATPVSRPGQISYSAGELSVTGYRAAVATAVERMRAGELDKVVLAHDLVASADHPLDQRYLLRNLADRYPSCWVFAVDGLVGATPELLLRRKGTRVTSRVLAGTTWPQRGESADELATGLLASAKNQGEHRYAVRSFTDSLRPLCDSLHAPESPSVLRLPNVLHLCSDVVGELRDTDVPSLIELAAAVHPTAAVGGTPTRHAVRVIEELEGMDRGRYAGPVGWIDGNGDGELGIALRCAEIRDNTARLFAGGGIVADSDPDVEVREAASKLIPVRDALEDN
ncbi:isochorismate synthase [Pseudonocardiaceae bacterium YIM PH 21723]|nr:isochorismate synthase [Pseudonocardiaceae bacterium YIM PH 21723]